MGFAVTRALRSRFGFCIAGLDVSTFFAVLRAACPFANEVWTSATLCRSLRVQILNSAENREPVNTVKLGFQWKLQWFQFQLSSLALAASTAEGL